MILDTASLYFRAYFGVPSSMRAPDGTQVNAVRGLMDSIARLVEQYRPSAVVAAWDNDWRPTWRVDLVPSYKAHRVAAGAGESVVGAGGHGAVSGQSEQTDEALVRQVPIILDVLDAFGIPVVGVDDHEADDVLGSYARQADRPVLVVTGDRDLFQLATDENADPRVQVIYVGKGVARHDLVDSAWVEAKYGVRADQYVDYSVLRGDASDGLPGVAGIGEKSAAQLIATYGGLDDIAAAATDPASGMSAGLRTRLGAAVDYLGPAQVVVQVVTDLTLPPVVDLAEAPRDDERVVELTERWGLGSSTERLLKALS